MMSVVGMGLVSLPQGLSLPSPKVALEVNAFCSGLYCEVFGVGSKVVWDFLYFVVTYKSVDCLVI